MAAFLTRLAFAFAALLIATVAFGAAVGFLFYAVFLFFVTLMVPPFAALATAGVLIAFAMIVLLIGRGLSGFGGRRRKPADPAAPAGASGFDAIGSMLGVDLATMAAKNPFLATGVAFVVGIVFGISPTLRRAATDLLRR